MFVYVLSYKRARAMLWQCFETSCFSKQHSYFNNDIYVYENLMQKEKKNQSKHEKVMFLTKILEHVN